MAKKVILYSTAGCPLCERYRAMLADHNQPFEERNTTENSRFLDDLASRGIFVVPTVLVDDHAVPGFRPNSVAELLAA
jgi:glutaredoxin